MSMIGDEPALVPHAARPSRIPVYLAVGFESGLALIAWLIGWPLGASPLATLQFSPSGLLFGLLATVPMLAAFFLLRRSKIPAIERIRQIFNEIAGPFFGSFTTFDLAVLSLVAGIGEEMLFRGFGQGALALWLGPWLALLLASVLFGLLHAITLTYAVLASLAGTYLGLVWIATDNLLTVILAHALYDFVALNYLLRDAAKKSAEPVVADAATVAK
jgi:membrane protease YdiL (CAAX protease family)